MARSNINVTAVRAPVDGVLEEISKLSRELVTLGRSEFVVPVSEYEKMPYAELLELVGNLSKEVIRAKRSKARGGESRVKEKTIKNEIRVIGNETIRLNSGNIRNAVILSEILGPPLSKRTRKPMF